MILDIRTRVVDGKPILEKLAPIGFSDSPPEIDGKGYILINFNDKEYAWQPVEEACGK